MISDMTLPLSPYLEARAVAFLVIGLAVLYVRQRLTLRRGSLCPCRPTHLFERRGLLIALTAERLQRIHVHSDLDSYAPLLPYTSTP